MLKAYAKVRKSQSRDDHADSTEQAAGKPFAIPTFTNYWVCVSDAKQISELRNAPSHQLSFKKFLQEVL